MQARLCLLFLVLLVGVVISEEEKDLLSTTTSSMCLPDQEIVLRPNSNRDVYARWRNVSTTLICDAPLLNSRIWYSPSEILHLSMDCPPELVQQELVNDSALHLDWFPESPYIKSKAWSLDLKLSTECTFTSHYGLLVGEKHTRKLIDEELEGFSTTIYLRPGVEFTYQLSICRGGIIRNGTCSTHHQNGTHFNHRSYASGFDKVFQFEGGFQPNNLDTLSCDAMIDGRSRRILVTIMHDVNECEEEAGKRNGSHLCQASECIDHFAGYACAKKDYTSLEGCGRDDGIMCPIEASSYIHMAPPATSCQCEVAANSGVELCEGGVTDCRDGDEVYGCANGMALVDVCLESAKTYNWTCPSLNFDEEASDSTRGARSLTGLVYNAQSLFRHNPDLFLNATRSLSDDAVIVELNSSRVDAHKVANHLIDSLLATFEHVTPQPPPLDSLPLDRGELAGNQTSNATARAEQQQQQPELSAITKVNVANSILHLVATIARNQPNVSRMLNEGMGNRRGVQFWHLNPDDTIKELNDSKGRSWRLEVLRQPSEEANSVMLALIPRSSAMPPPPPPPPSPPPPENEEGSPPGPPSPPLPPSPDNEIVSKLTTSSDDQMQLHSDVMLIDTADVNSTFHVTMISSEPQARETPTCQQLHDSNGSSKAAWSSDHCETIISGNEFKCRCRPYETRTFAIALVYWLGDAEIPVQSAWVNILNYVAAAVTIVSLLLFLTFMRTVGVYRLDQFNIALNLLLSAVVSLALPHVTDAQPISCIVLAILVTYFPLAAFAWKLVFGITTLLLVVAPRSSYHDMISRQSVCSPLVWIVNFLPSAFIGVWFGFAEEAHSHSICIGPSDMRWLFVGPITAVCIFNLLILVTVGVVLLRSYLLTRHSRITKSTHILVLTQLSLTLGLPYLLIHTQLFGGLVLLTVVPIAMAATSVLMFLLVAIIDEENRGRLCCFLRSRFSRSSSRSTRPTILSGKTNSNGGGSGGGAANGDKKGSWGGKSKQRQGSNFFYSGGPDSTGSPYSQNAGVDRGHSEAGTNDLTFEPGWLERQVAASTTQRGGQARDALADINKHSSPSTLRAPFQPSIGTVPL